MRDRYIISQWWRTWLAACALCLAACGREAGTFSVSFGFTGEQPEPGARYSVSARVKDEHGTTTAESPSAVFDPEARLHFPSVRNGDSYTIVVELHTLENDRIALFRTLETVRSASRGARGCAGRARDPNRSARRAAHPGCQLAEQLGGGTWRVPTKIELESLIDVSRVNAVDPLFDDFPIDSVWSSAPYPNPIVDGLKMSWQVDFMEGTSTARARAKASRVRCVSSASETGGSTQAIHFVDRVARDSNTQLEWQRLPEGTPRTWRDAIKYCEELELNGGGWPCRRSRSF